MLTRDRRDALERALQDTASRDVTSEQGHKGRASQAEEPHLQRPCGGREDAALAGD